MKSCSFPFEIKVQCKIIFEMKINFSKDSPSKPARQLADKNKSNGEEKDPLLKSSKTQSILHYL